MAGKSSKGAARRTRMASWLDNMPMHYGDWADKVLKRFSIAEIRHLRKNGAISPLIDLNFNTPGIFWVFYFPTPFMEPRPFSGRSIKVSGSGRNPGPASMPRKGFSDHEICEDNMTSSFQERQELIERRKMERREGQKLTSVQRIELERGGGERRKSDRRR